MLEGVVDDGNDALIRNGMWYAFGILAVVVILVKICAGCREKTACSEIGSAWL